MKRERGITLIALVITIIVLLILSGVTIAMITGEHGIIAKAKLAVKRTKQAQEKQQEDFANLVNQIDKIVGETSGESGTIRDGINVGDYIDYKPDGSEEDDGPVYAATELDEKYTGSTSNTDIKQDKDIKWQILKVYDDGSIDIIGTETSQPVYFKKATGYNNVVYILNDICKKLYSRESDGIYARSVNSKDFEKAETTEGTAAREKYISDKIEKLDGGTTYIQSVDKVNNTVTYEKDYSYYPNLYAQEIGAGIDEKPKTEGLEQIETSILDTTIGNEAEKQANNLTTTCTDYNLTIDETNYGETSKVLCNNGAGFWVASRGVECLDSKAQFVVQMCNRNTISRLWSFYFIS